MSGKNKVMAETDAGEEVDQEKAVTKKKVGGIPETFIDNNEDAFAAIDPKGEAKKIDDLAKEIGGELDQDGKSGRVAPKVTRGSSEGASNG